MTKRAMARRAEAERERRAKVIAAEHNSALVFPIPMDVLDAVREHLHEGSTDGVSPTRRD